MQNWGTDIILQTHVFPRETNCHHPLIWNIVTFAHLPLLTNMILGNVKKFYYSIQLLTGFSPNWFAPFLQFYLPSCFLSNAITKENQDKKTSWCGHCSPRNKKAFNILDQDDCFAFNILDQDHCFAFSWPLTTLSGLPLTIQHPKWPFHFTSSPISYLVDNKISCPDGISKSPLNIFEACFSQFY